MEIDANLAPNDLCSNFFIEHAIFFSKIAQKFLFYQNLRIYQMPIQITGNTRLRSRTKWLELVCCCWVCYSYFWMCCVQLKVRYPTYLSIFTIITITIIKTFKLDNDYQIFRNELGRAPHNLFCFVVKSAYLSMRPLAH